MNALLDAALEYARHNWPVFPCRAKLPLTANGFHDATTDPAQIRAWWTEHRGANIGLTPGRARLLVIDIDGPDGERLAQQLGLFSEPTLTVVTTRGRHLYWRHPGGHVGNRKLGKILDVRADSGYVLLPPSLHPSGHRYYWIGSVAEILPMPGVALDALRNTPDRLEQPSRTPAPVATGSPRRRAYVIAAIEAECLELANTMEGNRNNRLNEAAFGLARFIETREVDPAKLADVLTVAARHVGLDDEEIERTIASAFGARGVS
jgi:hypothetical protein